MGVLHIALPVSAHTRPSGRKHAIRRIPRPFPEQKSVISAATPVLQQISPEPTPRDTLPVQGKPLPSGVKLERTPEQDAANEALARLVRQCMAGDSQAWQQLVVSQHRRIYAICYRFTGSGSDLSLIHI